MESEIVREILNEFNNISDFFWEMEYMIIHTKWLPFMIYLSVVFIRKWRNIAIAWDP